MSEKKLNSDNLKEQENAAKGGAVVQWLVIAALLVVCALALPKLKEARDSKAEREQQRRIAESTQVVLYEGPRSLRDATAEDLESSAEKDRDMSLLHCTDTKVYVNGEECYVYDTNVNHTRMWYSNYYPPQSRTPITYFDFEGTVEITVEVPDKAFEEVSVSPASYGIEPTVDAAAHSVTFRVDTPDTYTLQFDHSPERAVHIFANPLEKEEELPDFDDPDVIYIGPGEWDIESISMKKGQTLYLAGGSVVHGTVSSNFISNVTICGRGILDGSGYETWKGTSASIPLKFSHCTGAVVKDIIVLNANAWACEAYDSADGVISNLKIVTSRPNGDGISIQSCSNYSIENCFVRTWDDSLVVKNYDLDSTDITFRNIQVWTDMAQSMEVGFETNKGKRADAVIRNILFEDITVLNNFHKPVISVHNADDALVEDITFRNITVEHEEVGSGDCDLPYLIDLAILQNSNWSSTPERGTIRNVTLENVNFLDGDAKGSRIMGYDAAHNIEGVLFQNVSMFGTKIESAEDGNIKVYDETVSGVEFR